ncbi:MAG: hypothetical protein OEV92_11600 [Nitrospinota bacterium]|nr:hypothetical protein [Nitrospinota bacterium]
MNKGSAGGIEDNIRLPAHEKMCEMMRRAGPGATTQALKAWVAMVY